MKPCSVAGCDGAARARHLCAKHYARARVAGDLGSHILQGLEGRPTTAGRRKYTGHCSKCDQPARTRGMCRKHYCAEWSANKHEESLLLPPRLCSVPGCARKHGANGLCRGHYARQRKTGGVSAETPIRKMGGERISPEGYALVYRPDDPHAKVDGYTFVHRLVMATMLGRPLLPNENVHHKNGDRADNRESNLELWSTSQPSGQRVPDKIRWAKELIRLYEASECDDAHYW